jgi:RNA polymerase sigma-70 factor, ECF subfamily
MNHVSRDDRTDIGRAIAGTAPVDAQTFDPVERALVAACLAYDDRAIKELVATHRPAIARLAWVLLGREEVDDVCQDVYLRVFRGLDQFEHRSRLSTWICRITLNVIRNRQRTARRRRFDAHISFDDLDYRDHVESFRDPVTPASISESRERARRLRNAIRALPPVQRRALILWTYSDSSHANIARSIGLSLPEIKHALRLAKREVRTRLD